MKQQISPATAIIIILVVVIVAAAIGYFLFFRAKGGADVDELDQDALKNLDRKTNEGVGGAAMPQPPMPGAEGSQ